MPLVITSPLRGWASTLDDVPDPVFANKILGDGVAIQPMNDLVCAPCDGEVATLHEAGHAVCVRSVEGVEVLIHVGLDTVALKGKGFQPLVAVGATVRRGDPLIRFDLDAVALGATSLITPVIVTNAEAFTIGRRTTGQLVGARAELMVLTPVASEAVCSAEGGEAVEAGVTLSLPHGIHARPAARICECVRKFEAEVRLVSGDKKADARSTVSLLALGTRLGDDVIVRARGRDAEEALAAVLALLSTDMGEGKTAPPSPRPPAPPLASLLAGQIGGVTASPGLAMGPAARIVRNAVIVESRAGEVAQERAALVAARARVAATLRSTGGGADDTVVSVMKAHLSLLDDPQLLAAAEHLLADGSSAGEAWQGAIRSQAELVRGTGNAHLIERIDDLLDLERQVLAALAGDSAGGQDFPRGAILVADDLLPSELVALAAKGPAGICLMRGGPTSHVAILCAGMGIPLLVAMGEALGRVENGVEILLDADGGYAHVAPSQSERDLHAARLARQRARRDEAMRASADLCRTADGVRIEIFANLGNVAEASSAVAGGAEGSGLVRSEFLFLGRTEPPSVEEQRATYQAIADAMECRPVIIRLLDIGGDKPTSFVAIASEENPALGERGIRVGIRNPQLLEDQVRAILGVRPAGQCRIMIPMVTDVTEVRHVRDIVDRLCREMGILDTIEVGVMVETAAAAASADLLAAEADFLSIGTNDLTQYVLAKDRGNPAVAAGIDALHPAVLRMIADTCRLAAQKDRWVGVCGSLASDPAAIPILIGLGVTELSTVPGFVAEAKQIVRSLRQPDAKSHAMRALQCSGAAEVRALAREFEEGE